MVHQDREFSAITSYNGDRIHLLRGRDTSFAAKLKVNCKYKYVDKDISSILQIRLDNENPRGLRNIFTIAPVGENERTLVTFLNEERINNKLSSNRTLLIPYLIGSNEDGHWVGVVVKFENNVVTRIEYYDSLANSIAVQLVQDLNQAYGDDVTNKIHEIRDNVIRQDDYSSCGPCMIENLVNAAKPASNSLLSLYEIRKNHILLMLDIPDGQDFYERQLHNNYNISTSQYTKNEITTANNQRCAEGQEEDLALKRGIKRNADYSDELAKHDECILLSMQNGISSNGMVHEEIDTSLFIKRARTLSARRCVDDGNSLLKQQNVSGAISKYDQAIKECPYYAVPRYNKRIAMRIQNDSNNDLEHCNLANRVNPYFVVNIIAVVPERRSSDDSSAEENDEEFDKLYLCICSLFGYLCIGNNDWPFTTTPPKKTTNVKTELMSIDPNFSCKIQDRTDSIVVDPLLSKISENAFEGYKNPKLSSIAVSVGLNRMHSLSKRKNNSLILELESNVYRTREIKVKTFGYYWKCLWYTKDGKKANIEDVRKFYKKLKSKDPELAKKFIEQEEKVAECNVPYQCIREYAKNHPKTKELVKEFRDNNHAAIVYLHLVDADVLDFNGVHSAYLRILDDCYEPPTVMSTGYEFPKDLQNMAYYLLSHMERMHRVITTFHVPLGTYYPEPNMCILIAQNCETVEESFIDSKRGKGRSLESPILLSNIQNNRQNVHAIFSEDNPIITNIPSRAKKSKQRKQPLGFSDEFNNGPAAPTSEDIKKYAQVSQSHSNNLTWIQNLFINNSIEYDKGYETDDECIYNKKHQPLKGVDKQCKHLIGNIRKGDDVEQSRSKLANRIGEDNANNIVNAIENINQYDNYFNETYKRTQEEQDFIDILEEREISYNNLSRKSLLMIINSPIMDSIRDNKIDLEQLLELDEEIIQFTLDNDEIIRALQNEQVDFDDLENCLTDEEIRDNVREALNNGYTAKDIFNLYREDPMHLQFMATHDPADLVYTKSNRHDIVDFAIKNGYIDDDDIRNIKNELMGDREDTPAAYMEFEAWVLMSTEGDTDNPERDTESDDYNFFNEYSDECSDEYKSGTRYKSDNSSDEC